MKVALWILAILAIVGPCMYMSSGGGKVASAGATMALTTQMRQQALIFEMQMMEQISMESAALDREYLEKIVNQLNAQNSQAMSPESVAVMKKEGMNPAMMPKPIPWQVAPVSQKRTLTLSSTGEGLLIQGWGTDLNKPLYEHKIPLSRMR